MKYKNKIIALVGAAVLAALIYDLGGSVCMFSALAEARENSKRQIIFNRHNNSYRATIEITSNDLYYLNWYPHIILSLKTINFEKTTQIVCKFTNSYGNVNEQKIFSISAVGEFNVGPLGKGENLIELFFLTDYQESNIVGEILFEETSNVGSPWFRLLKTCGYSLILITTIALGVKNKSS